MRCLRFPCGPAEFEDGRKDAALEGSHAATLFLNGHVVGAPSRDMRRNPLSESSCRGLVATERQQVVQLAKIAGASNMAKATVDPNGDDFRRRKPVIFWLLLSNSQQSLVHGQ